jgi:hypothetical protein
MSDFIKLSSVALDCPNAIELAAFYADITGGKVTFQDEAWATVDGPGGRIDFQTVPGYTPPTWPDPTSSIQMHLDFYVDDREATEVRVLAAGARRYDFQPNSDHCYVYADPAGHPFCLSTWNDVQHAIDETMSPSTPAVETERLLSYLNAQRAHVLGILEGLDEQPLRRPLLPSGWSCLGLVQHLTLDIERFWFRGVVAGERAVTDEPVEADDDAWKVPPEVPAETVLASYRDEIDRANTIIAATGLDAAPAWWPGDLFGEWRLDDLGDVLLHVITETACHAGHLDAARELIDGRTWLVVTE